MHHQADAAEQQQQRRRPGGRFAPGARRAVDQEEGKQHEGAARQADARVELHHGAQRVAEAGRHPVVERRVVQPEQPRHARHDTFAAARHLVHDAQANGVVRFP